ncbi:MAG: hypothetical protein Q7S28_00065 [bacterium]|nr:hypothetical protein [bacterium]
MRKIVRAMLALFVLIFSAVIAYTHIGWAGTLFLVFWELVAFGILRMIRREQRRKKNEDGGGGIVVPFDKDRFK